VNATETRRLVAFVSLLVLAVSPIVAQEETPSAPALTVEAGWFPLGLVEGIPVEVDWFSPYLSLGCRFDSGFELEAIAMYGEGSGELLLGALAGTSFQRPFSAFGGALAFGWRLSAGLAVPLFPAPGEYWAAWRVDTFGTFLVPVASGALFLGFGGGDGRPPVEIGVRGWFVQRGEWIWSDDPMVAMLEFFCLMPLRYAFRWQIFARLTL
jgi:hypothetical protein